MKIFRILMVVSLCSSVMLAQQAIPISKVLQSNGTIDISKLKNTVALNPDGYTLHVPTLTSSPRFIPATPTQIQAHPNDVFWSAQFGPSSNEQITIKTIIVSNGRIIIGGAFDKFLGLTCNSVAYWDGSRWRAIDRGVELASGGTASVNALAAAPNGDVYIGGVFGKTGNQTCQNIAVWKGTTITPVSAGVTGSVNALSYHNSMLYVGGNFTIDGVANAKNIAAWNGTEWKGLNNGISSGTVYALLANDNAVYVGGNFATIDNLVVNDIAAWNISTSAWQKLGDGFTATGNAKTNVYCMAVASNGDLVIGGDFAKSGTKTVRNMARWNGSEWSEFGGGADGEITAILIDGNTAYVSGGFFKIGNKDINTVARFDGSTWNDMGGDQIQGTAQALVKFEDKLLAGGTFEIPLTAQFTVQGIALYDGTTWTAVGGNRGNGTDGNIAHMGTDTEGRLYVAGDFSRTGGINARGIARFTSGDTWETVDSTGIDPQSTFIRMDVRENNMIIGAAFKKPGVIEGVGVARLNLQTSAFELLGTVFGNFNSRRINVVTSRNNYVACGGTFRGVLPDSSRAVALYDGTNWVKLAGGVSGGSQAQVVAIALDNNNDMYVGGAFTTAGTTACANIALWNGTQWNDIGGITSTAETPVVNAIAIIGDNIYVGGRFNKAGGTVDVKNLARYNKTTRQWSAVGAGTDNGIQTFYVKGDYLFIGGDFLTANGLPAGGIARYDTKNNSWYTFGSGTDGSVYAITSAYNGIFAGGSFLAAGGKLSSHIGKWQLDATPVEDESSSSTINTQSGVYPNPTQATTALTFTTQVDADVTLTILNELGQTITTVLNAPMQQGTHTITWDASAYPSGVYFARLQCGKSIITKKILVTR